MSETVVVHKLNHEGRETWRYYGQTLEHGERRWLIQAQFDRDDVGFFGLDLRRGDTFIETYYSDRWYNVFAVYDVDDGRLKGWYVNLTRPARFEPGHIYADDLALDLVIDPGGRITVVDEDEFEALNLDAHERKQVWAAVNEVEALVNQGLEPFDAQAKL